MLSRFGVIEALDGLLSRSKMGASLNSRTALADALQIRANRFEPRLFMRTTSLTSKKTAMRRTSVEVDLSRIRKNKSLSHNMASDHLR